MLLHTAQQRQGSASVVARVVTEETACFIMTYDAAMSSAGKSATSRNFHG